MNALIDTCAMFSFMNLRTVRLHFQHIPWKAAMLNAKTRSGESLKVVTQHQMSIKIGKTEAVDRLSVVQHMCVIVNPGRWVWLNREWIPTKTVTAPVVDEVEKAYVIGEVAANVVIPPRSGKWIPAVAPDNVEGKVVDVMPKGKFKDNTDLLIANSVDQVADGVVLAWVVNTTEREVKIDLFEDLAEVPECEILDADDDEDVEKGEESFTNSGFTLPNVDNPPMIYPQPGICSRICRDMQSEECQLLFDILKRVQDEKDITEPIWGLNLMESELTM